MTKLLKTAAIAAIITGFGVSANALDVTAPLSEPGFGVEMIEGATAQQTTDGLPILSEDARIGVARMDGGRLIPAPHGEVYDWQLLRKRTDRNIEVMNAGDYLKYIPEIPFNGVDTDNKIDEIRLTAANEGYSHVIIYGVGPDAYKTSLGGKTAQQAGLKPKPSGKALNGAKAVALLIDSHTGDVLGAAKTDNVAYNIGYLVDDVEQVLENLSQI